MEEQLDNLTLGEHLGDFAADLLSERKLNIFLERLLSRNAGIWSHIISIANDLPGIPQRLRAIQAESEEPDSDLELSVTWLDFPGASKGFCVVIFFSPLTLWSFTAFLNKDNVLNELSQRIALDKETVEPLDRTGP